MVTIVNEEHLALCSSPEWARFVEDELLPWVLGGHDLGDALLEVGPGPGLTTDAPRAAGSAAGRGRARSGPGRPARRTAGGQQRCGRAGRRSLPAVRSSELLSGRLPDDA